MLWACMPVLNLHVSILSPVSRTLQALRCHTSDWVVCGCTGASETEELYHVLTSCMMVRRLKKDVLSQLPPKRRTQVPTFWPLFCDNLVNPQTFTWMLISMPHQPCHNF